ncbi:diguanylate cyclase [Hoeflea alexandrii]|jgi:diguanylate cyclase (GGDEF)-like protein|uniref:diguanylate cyclase n=1 Tax=Hoeflea TaxID=274591 RepID=UPI001252D8BC|nr:diguanylate cyclase [Hoeflea sp. EC-HK425]VVT19065.1 putative Diguanylate cyclase [Hoeflea sp. EC-HK425]
MPFYPLPAQETERLEKLRSYEILDSLPEEAHVRITRLAAKTFNVPIAAISLIEGDKLWFKAHIGNAYNEISRKLTFCAHAICQDEVFVVEDATKDPRFSDNPYVTGAPHLRFYAGAPLRASGGLNLGTVNILDTKPRTITDDERESLADLAAMVIDSFEMRQLLNRANAAERRFIDAMESLPNGFVLYDKDDRLVICNERYREIYAESAKYIVPGASFEEIIRNGVENGQYPDAIGNEEAWIAERLEMHQNPGEPIEQHLPGDTWLRVQERRTSEGGLVGFRFDITELKRQERELIRLAWTDSLTDAMNRHRFMDLAGKEIERTKRRNGELSLLLLDADHFKQINDKYGHAAGDAILKGLVERWTRSLRSHDLIGRIGGEEFSILLPEANAANAIRTANRLRKEIAEVPFAFEGQLLRVTVSIGVATLAAGEDLPSLMQRADRALYRAKEAGRDEVIASAA